MEGPGSVRSSSEGTFELLASRSDGGWLLTAHGAIDRRSAGHIEDTVTMYARPRVDIVIDLTGVTRLDDRGFESILRSTRAAERAGATLRLRGRINRTDSEMS